jgi:hypothetical protein
MPPSGSITPVHQESNLLPFRWQRPSDGSSRTRLFETGPRLLRRASPLDRHALWHVSQWQVRKRALTTNKYTPIGTACQVLQHCPCRAHTRLQQEPCHTITKTQYTLSCPYCPVYEPRARASPADQNWDAAGWRLCRPKAVPTTADGAETNTVDFSWQGPAVSPDETILLLRPNILGTHMATINSPTGFGLYSGLPPLARLARLDTIEEWPSPRSFPFRSQAREDARHFSDYTQNGTECHQQ